MQSTTAYEGAYGHLHRSKGAAIAEIIEDAGRGTMAALLDTKDPNYQKRLQDAILNAAEIIKKLRAKPPRSR